MHAPPPASDCLVLNWALPRKRMPDPPLPLTYDHRIGSDGDYVFVSVRIGWDCRCRLPGLARPRIDAPRLDVAFAVLGADRRRGWWFRDLLVPAWCLPLMAFGGDRPATAARFECSRPSQQPNAPSWRWAVDRGLALVAEGRKGAPAGQGAEPRFASWNDAVRFFEERPARFRIRETAVETVELSSGRPQVWPMSVEILDSSLVASLLGLDLEDMPPLHSAWLHGDMALAQVTEEGRVPSRVPAPG